MPGRARVRRWLAADDRESATNREFDALEHQTADTRRTAGGLNTASCHTLQATSSAMSQAVVVRPSA